MDPHAEQQIALLERIVGSVVKLNGVVSQLNTAVKEVEQHRDRIAYVSDVWSKYNRNLQLTTAAANIHRR